MWLLKGAQARRTEIRERREKDAPSQRRYSIPTEA